MAGLCFSTHKADSTGKADGPAASSTRGAGRCGGAGGGAVFGGGAVAATWAALADISSRRLASSIKGVPTCVEKSQEPAANAPAPPNLFSFRILGGTALHADQQICCFGAHRLCDATTVPFDERFCVLSIAAASSNSIKQKGTRCAPRQTGECACQNKNFAGQAIVRAAGQLVSRNAWLVGPLCGPHFRCVQNLRGTVTRWFITLSAYRKNKLVFRAKRRTRKYSALRSKLWLRACFPVSHLSGERPAPKWYSRTSRASPPPPLHRCSQSPPPPAWNLEQLLS